MKTNVSGVKMDLIALKRFAFKTQVFQHIAVKHIAPEMGKINLGVSLYLKMINVNGAKMAQTVLKKYVFKIHKYLHIVNPHTVMAREKISHNVYQ